MAKNIRIVPASGSIFLTADGFDVTGSIRLQTVGSTEDVQFIARSLGYNCKKYKAKAYWLAIQFDHNSFSIYFSKLL